MKPIEFCSFGGYRFGCTMWWDDLMWYLIGLSVRYTIQHYDHLPWYARWSWGRPGWLHDLLSYWHRARYGWASKDVWSLDDYLYRVMAGTLTHLANISHGGCPGNYPFQAAWVHDIFDGQIRPWVEGHDSYDAMCHDHDRWVADLRRWAAAFDHVTTFDYSDKHDKNYAAWHADEEQRHAEALACLQEMLPWWRALWD